jgi:hypothetical protein
MTFGGIDLSHCRQLQKKQCDNWDPLKRSRYVMEGLTRKSVAIFSSPFRVPGFDETLPAGEYDVETELSSPPDHRNPKAWKASVLVNLQPRASHPGLARTLTVSLADLERAQAKDKLTGQELADLFLEEMLADPMVRLVMEADGVSEIQLRQLYSGSRRTEAVIGDTKSNHEIKNHQDSLPIETAENEGMVMRPN